MTSTPKPVRTFVAATIVLPPALRTILRELREMGRAVKAVNSESLHITLKFLGDIKPDQLPEVQTLLETAAERVPTFALELVGIGAFPHWDRPQVVWVGTDFPDPLLELARQLEQDLEPLGFPKEKRAYHPHLTLARIKAKPPTELKELADAHETESFGRQPIEQVVLYQSDLTPAGSVYTPMLTVSLPEQR